jgi:hypothetical protein
MFPVHKHSTHSSKGVLIIQPVTRNEPPELVQISLEQSLLSYKNIRSFFLMLDHLATGFNTVYVVQ